MLRLLLLLPLLTPFLLTGCGERGSPSASSASAPRAVRAPPPQPARVVAALERTLADDDRGVRYAAVMALGKAGVDPSVLEGATEDPAWCVRAEAKWWRRRLTRPGRGANEAVDGQVTIPAVPAQPVLTAAETRRALASLEDAERDIRMRAAIDLARSQGDVTEALLRALRDPSWRVQREAVRSLGVLRQGASALGPLLRSDTVPLAEAARDALCVLGPAAAAPAAAALATADYGALHWGRTVFETLGADGAGGVAALTTLLAHADVNARETAARCLRAIGPAARPAQAALLRCLADERLCVVSNAALALGAIGVSRDLLQALSHEQARVRAYAAFALGWALGAERAIDQVPFEMRLPVLDVGGASNLDGGAVPDLPTVEAAFADERAPDVAVLKRAIWSSDPAVSVRAAARLEFQMVDARESERVMELLLPEGLREDTPVDFGNLRWIIGSTEVPACLLYFVRANLPVKRRSYVCGNFHRLALPWHLPVMCWFERTHEASQLEGTGELWFSVWYSAQYGRVSSWSRGQSDPGPDMRRIVQRVLEEDVKHLPETTVGPLPRWPLNDILFAQEDVPWMLHAAKELHQKTPARGNARAPWRALVRALSRLDDPESLAYLRAFDKGAETPAFILAALVRRGEAGALSYLREKSRVRDYALLLLMEVAPREGRSVLVERILAMAQNKDEEEDIHLPLHEWSEDAVVDRVQLEPEDFLGVEAELAAARLPLPVLLEVIRKIPLCNTRRLLAQVFAHLEAPAGFPRVDSNDSSLESEAPKAQVDWILDETIALLHLSDEERLLALLRRLIRSPHADQRRYATRTLLKLGDVPSTDAILACAKALFPDTLRAEMHDQLLSRLPGPSTRTYLRDFVAHPDVEPDARRLALMNLARLQGLDPGAADELGCALPSGPAETPEDAAEEEARLPLRVAVLENRMGDLRKEMAAVARQSPPGIQQRLLWRTMAGDRVARAELWSMLRAGRYGTAHYQTPPIHRLDWDLGVLPHWLIELESNCCRVSDGLEEHVIESGLGMPDVYGSESSGIGQSLTERALIWMRLMGGDFVWSPITGRWVRRPE